MKQEEKFYVIQHQAEGKFFAGVDERSSKMEYAGKVWMVRADATGHAESTARRRYETISREHSVGKHKCKVCCVHATYVIDEQGLEFETLG
jgi:hypothetical protein